MMCIFQAVSFVLFCRCLRCDMSRWCRSTPLSGRKSAQLSRTSRTRCGRRHTPIRSSYASCCCIRIDMACTCTVLYSYILCTCALHWVQNSNTDSNIFRRRYGSVTASRRHQVYFIIVLKTNSRRARRTLLFWPHLVLQSSFAHAHNNFCYLKNALEILWKSTLYYTRTVLNA